MSVCQACAEYSIKSCSSTIELKAGLSPNTEYYWLITNPKNKVYQRRATTDDTGKLTIDATVFPAGLLNPYAGMFELQIRDGSDYLTVVPMTLQGASFDCIKFSFQDIDDTNPFNIIQ